MIAGAAVGRPCTRNHIEGSENHVTFTIASPRPDVGGIPHGHVLIGKVLFLNQANQVLGYTQISEGGITETSVDVRMILQAALLTNSVSLILAHNHPSGNLKPSTLDIELTRCIKEAAKLMRINVLDHIIMTSESYYSFSDEGTL